MLPGTTPGFSGPCAVLSVRSPAPEVRMRDLPSCHALSRMCPGSGPVPPQTGSSPCFPVVTVTRGPVDGEDGIDPAASSLVPVSGMSPEAGGQGAHLVCGNHAPGTSMAAAPCVPCRRRSRAGTGIAPAAVNRCNPTPGRSTVTGGVVAVPWRRARAFRWCHDPGCGMRRR